MMLARNGKRHVGWLAGLMLVLPHLSASGSAPGVPASSSSHASERIVGFSYYPMSDLLVGPGCIDHRERQYMEYLGARKVCISQKFDVTTTYS